MTNFKSQLQALISEAAEKSVNRNMLDLREADARVRHFKQGCDFLIPILMAAVEQRDYSYTQYKRLLEENEIKTSDGFKVSFNDEVINEDNEELLSEIK